MQYLLAVLYGLVFGIANIIPGVSGGTMLVVFGCYDKVCGALSLNLKEIKKNIVFLIFFGIGAAAGIVGFAFVITWLFDNFPTQTYMFFIGLIIGSIPLIIRNATSKEKFRPSCLVPFIAALLIVVGLSVLEQTSGSNEPYSITSSVSDELTTITIENNSDRVINEWSIEILDGGLDTKMNIASDNAEAEVYHDTVYKIKQLFGLNKDEPAPLYNNNLIRSRNGYEIAPHESFSFSYFNKYSDFSTDLSNLKFSYSYKADFMFIAFVLISTFVAAVAMIIPGVSGSFIMILFGVYGTVISSIKSFNFAVLIPTAVGVILGVVLGARLISMLLKKHRLMVFSAILGLVAGSVYAVLPAGFGLNTETLIGAAALLAGAAASFTVGKHTKTE